jgi:hypothetical protein
VYSTGSTYATFFQGQTTLCRVKEVWHIRVPQEHIFFLWLAVQDRCWMAERRRWHRVTDQDDYAFCYQSVETIDYLLTGCTFSRKL